MSPARPRVHLNAAPSEGVDAITNSARQGGVVIVAEEIVQSDDADIRSALSRGRRHRDGAGCGG